MATAMQQEEKLKIQPAKKKRMNVQGFVNSPYLFAVVPLLLGGFYLIMHPQYIVLAMQYPYALGFLVGLIPTVFIIKLIINFFSVIEQWICLQFEKAKGAKRSQFLEFVIAVFMFVSICEAGPFFNDAQGHILWGSLGYITVFAFDLVAVVCMRSRAKSLRKGNDKKAFVYEVGVWICALVSIYANFHSVSQNLAALTSGKTDWLTGLAPLVGVAFPVMIIFLSYATDADDDVDDPEVYKKEQEKRVLFLVAKREIATRMHEERLRIDLVKDREFFLKSWLFTRKKVAFVTDAVATQTKETINKEVATLKSELLQKEQIIRSQVQHIETLSMEVKGISSALHEQRNFLEEQCRNMAFQMDQITQIRDEILNTNHDFTGSIERQMDVKIRLANSDLQRQIEQIRMASVAHLVANKPENKTDLKTDLEVPNTSKSEPKESDQTNKEIPVNYGLNDAEVQALIMAFPGVKEWFDDTRSSVSESEIIDATNTRLNSLKGAIANHTIRPARGRGNKLQTETVLPWLLGRLKKSANRVRNTGSNATENSNEIQTNREPNTGEMEAIETSNNYHNGNGNGHKTDKLSLDDLTPLEV